MGFMTTGGPAVRGQAWNFLSDTVLGVVPDHHSVQILTGAGMFCGGSMRIGHPSLPPKTFFCATRTSEPYAMAKEAARPAMMYLPDIAETTPLSTGNGWLLIQESVTN